MVSDVTKRWAWDRLARSDRLKRYYGYRADKLIRLNKWGLRTAAVLAAVSPFVGDLGPIPVGPLCAGAAALLIALLSIADTPRRATAAESTAEQVDLIHGEFVALWYKIEADDPSLTDSDLLEELRVQSAHMTRLTAGHGEIDKRLRKKSEAESDAFLPKQFARDRTTPAVPANHSTTA